jgi:NAD(P)-dependent dehydrogenase (short-subunit alcohol dehydrogenase family)
VNAAVDAALERFGRVDILVHEAGVGVHKEIVDLTDEEWDLQIDVQLRGAFLLSWAVGRRLLAQGEGDGSSSWDRHRGTTPGRSRGRTRRRRRARSSLRGCSRRSWGGTGSRRTWSRRG